MTRDGNGYISLSSKALGVIIVAAIGAGGAGSWFGTRSVAAEPPALQASVDAHLQMDEGRNARQDAEIRALKEQLEKMDKKLDILLARR